MSEDKMKTPDCSVAINAAASSTSVLDNISRPASEREPETPEMLSEDEIFERAVARYRAARYRAECAVPSLTSQLSEETSEEDASNFLPCGKGTYHCAP